MSASPAIGTDDPATSWLVDPQHLEWLRAEATAQLDFFRPSLRSDGGFDTLARSGAPLPRGPQELHVTTRMIHSYALGKAFGASDCDPIIDAGMAYLWQHHRDPEHGGYVWSTGPQGDATKLAYGHVFVLLAAASAKLAGHPDADRLLADIAEVLDTRYWEDSHGLFADEFTRDWQPFSAYRGMNANMHGTEALLAAFEATGEQIYLARAGRILDFFITRMAPAHAWRLPEHYTVAWQVDPDYAGNPMFRPAGTTPGHSLEFARLALQHWDLSGRPGTPPDGPRRLIEQALADAWLPDGGIAYTLAHDGSVAIADRYWWPVTEGIGALATLLKLCPEPQDEATYRRLWHFADSHFIDHANGGWYPEIDAEGHATETQFTGKPDIYHSLQATLFPLVPETTRFMAALARADTTG
ncbi:AGE family epimerase/isomerase [Algicella marina]|uniref:AGE family epimerase/isomerase n=1 Tax=Algicella marina TaxID=2683284 RepID=A0A6P1SZY5_9RHOB|nr:AGE family epimerase/isomerase [Algicella marina]QHQ35170.1 AGE family epimerase/isomerase [Algicella marina]